MVLDLFDSGRVKCVKAARGHTLVEMLAVVAIIALIVGIGLPNLSFWLAQYRLRAAAISLTNHLNAARLLAIFKGATHQAQIATVDKGNYYQIVADPDGADIVVRGIGRIVMNKEFIGVSIVTVKTANDKPGRISFFPRGTSNSGSILLENTRKARVEIVISNGRVRAKF